MIFPKSKMRIIEVHDGKRPEQGWLELNTASVDLEGVSKIYINLDELETLRKEMGQASEAAERARKLLGG
ncbi:MAG: hypothetical protein WHZ52_01385 [Armatimonadota bacterium]|jgi:hypothetical protein